MRRLCGPLFIFTGVLHFAIPKVYARIVPPYIPAPMATVYASGVAEIAGGLCGSSGSPSRLLLFPMGRSWRFRWRSARLLRCGR